MRFSIDRATNEENSSSNIDTALGNRYLLTPVRSDSFVFPTVEVAYLHGWSARMALVILDL